MHRDAWRRGQGEPQAFRSRATLRRYSNDGPHHLRRIALFRKLRFARTRNVIADGLFVDTVSN